MHRGIGPEVLQLDVTLFLMQWGQFTDHDVVLTPAFTGKSTISEQKNQNSLYVSAVLALCLLAAPFYFANTLDPNQ